MDILQVIKVRPKPQGYWFSKSKWDILRAMRESTDFIVVVKDEKGVDQMMEKTDVIGKILNIKDETFVMRPDGIITKVNVGVVTT